MKVWQETAFAPAVKDARSRILAANAAAVAVFDNAVAAALCEDVTTPRDRLVLYSVTGLPTPENRQKAEAFVRENPGYMCLGNTAGGKALEAAKLFETTGIDRDAAYLPWFIVSSRLVEAASGNLTAFVDAAHPSSTFRRVEIPAALFNPAVKTINGGDKWAFESLVSEHHEWFQRVVPSRTAVAKPVMVTPAPTR